MPEENETYLAHLDGRVTGLERDVSNIGQQLTQVGKDMRAGLATLREEVAAISVTASASSRTDWSMLAAWATALLMFIGMVGGAIIAPLSSNQAKLAKEFAAHQQADGHPTIVAKLEAEREIRQQADQHERELRQQADQHAHELLDTRLAHTLTMIEGVEQDLDEHTSDAYHPQGVLRSLDALKAEFNVWREQQQQNRGQP